MRQRDSEHFPQKNIIKHTASEADTYYPDLNLANVFRLDVSLYDTEIGTPKNPRDCQYIRLEIVSAVSMDVEFSEVFHFDGETVGAETQENNDLIIAEGFYNADSEKWNMLLMGIKAA